MLDPAIDPERARKHVDGHGAADASSSAAAHAAGDEPSTAERISRVLPEAIRIATRRGERLTRALGPAVEAAVADAVRRNPKALVDAMYPVIGPSIRRSIVSTLAQMTQGFNRALEQSLTPRGLGWRVEAWRAKKPFAEVVLIHMLVYRVEQVFLIRTESGTLISHLTLPAVRAQDPDLVAGMLEAIQSFVSDSFARGDEDLSELEFGDRDLEIVRGPLATLAVLVRGEAPETLRARLVETLETIHLWFGDELASRGDDSELADEVRPLLERCFHSQERPRGKNSFAQWSLAIGALVATFLITRAALETRASRDEHRRIAEAIEREPGYVWISSERSGRRHRVRVLRDPMAREPAAVLADAFVDVERVVLDARPFQSLDEAIVIARAMQAADGSDAVQRADASELADTD